MSDKLMAHGRNCGCKTVNGSLDEASSRKVRPDSGIIRAGLEKHGERHQIGALTLTIQ